MFKRWFKSFLFSARCLNTRDGGNCEALFKKYAFDQESQKCEEFIYGGCDGNDNNFKTMDECKETCEIK